MHPWATPAPRPNRPATRPPSTRPAAPGARRARSRNTVRETDSVLLHRARDEISPTALCARQARTCASDARRPMDRSWERASPSPNIATGRRGGGAKGRYKSPTDEPTPGRASRRRSRLAKPPWSHPRPEQRPPRPLPNPRRPPSSKRRSRRARTRASSRQRGGTPPKSPNMADPGRRRRCPTPRRPRRHGATTTRPTTPPTEYHAAHTAPPRDRKSVV